PRDPAVAEDEAVLEPVPQSPELDLSSGTAPVRRVRADLGQHGLLADRPRSDLVGRLRPSAWCHLFHRPLLPLFRNPYAAPKARRLAAVEEGRGLLRVFPLSNRRPCPQRASGAGSPYAFTVGALPRISSDGEGIGEGHGRSRRADRRRGFQEVVPRPA